MPRPRPDYNRISSLFAPAHRSHCIRGCEATVDDRRLRPTFIAFLFLLNLGFVPSIDLSSQPFEWSTFTRHNAPIVDDFVNAVAFDSSGNQWIGTMTGGIYRVSGSEWRRYYTGNSVLPSDTIISILVHPDGTCWFGTHGGGLVSYKDGLWQVFDTGNSGLPSNDVSGNAFILGPDSSLWVGTWGGGMSRFHEGIWTTYDTANSPLPDQTVWTACVDSSNALWFGTLNGLARFRDGEWTVFTTVNSCLPLNDVASLCAHADGSIWMGTWGAGIARFDGANWWKFDVWNSPLPNNRVEALTYDSLGRLWIGTWGGGVAVFDGHDWIVLDSSNSYLPSNNIRMFLHDGPNGRMWICSDGGLAVCSYRTVTSVRRQIKGRTNLEVVAGQRSGEHHVRITLERPAATTLAMFGIRGERVTTLYDGQLPEGDHQFAIPVGIADGLYFCRMELDGASCMSAPILIGTGSVARMSSAARVVPQPIGFFLSPEYHGEPCMNSP